MITTRLNKFLVTISLAGLLIGCGGGGAESSDPTNSVGQSSNNATVQASTPLPSKITLSGHVMGNDPANCQVVVKVGNQQYSADVLTDSTGAFSIEVDPGAPSDLVTLEAIDPSTGLHWVLVPGDFEEVAAQAQNGKVEELDLWTVSTASFALAKALSNDSSIDTAGEYESLLAQASSEELTNIASALQILTNGTNGLTIPSGYADYLQLALDIANSTSSFLSDVELIYPGTIESTKQQIFASSGINSGFDTNTEAGVYVSADQNTLYALYENGNGVASFFDDNFASDIDQWDVTADGDMVLTYVQSEGRSDRLRLLNNSEITIQTLQQKSLTTATGSDISPATFDLYAFAGAFDEAQVPGSYSMSSIDATSAILTAGGGGQLVAADGTIESPLTWTVDGDGRLVVKITLSNRTIIVSQLESGRIESPALLSSVLPGGFIERLDVVDFAAQ